MSSSRNGSSGGITVLGLLGVAFVILKLCGVIDWSWWWVTAPFWGGFALLLAICVVLLLIAGAAGGVAALLPDDRQNVKVRR